MQRATAFSTDMPGAGMLPSRGVATRPPKLRRLLSAMAAADARTRVVCGMWLGHGYDREWSDKPDAPRPQMSPKWRTNWPERVRALTEASDCEKGKGR